jgi:hypothetical protein
MRAGSLQLASVIILGAVLDAMGQSAQTNNPGPPPPSPHWYQSVANGVTLHHLTPVAYFRGLLGMTPEERAKVLADKSPQERSQVLAKVREYEALPRDVCDERLRQTELHWYLLVLLRLEPGDRAARLKEISPLYQPMILAQLVQWDQLPADMRKALLEKESFLRAYAQWQGHSPAAHEDFLSKLPAEERARWAEELNRWQGLPESQREDLCAAFRRFFYLTGEEQKETIQALSETERRQMEQALQSYANLPPEKQRQCVDSFSKFASMSAEERSQFLQNAAKWEAMTAHERQVWRAMVTELPPMPADFYRSQMPPFPPGLNPPPAPPGPSASSTTVTNMAETAK